MLKLFIALALLTAVTATTWASPFAESPRAAHRIGGGVHYLHNLGDIKDTGVNNLDLNKDSFGLIASYQYDPGLFKFELDGEYIFNFLGTDKGMTEPSAWLLLGGLLYGGGGIGIGYYDGDFQKKPFYALRLGADIPLSRLDLDLFSEYRFQDAEGLQNAVDNLNSVTFGALVRFAVGGK